MKKILFALALALVTGSALAQSGKVEVLWLGHSTFRITSPGGKVIVIDPWLQTNPKTPPAFKNLAALGKVDALLVTHGHPDHVTDAPALAKMHNVRLYTSSSLLRTLVEVGMLPQELAGPMNKSGTVTPLGPDIRITMVRAEHSAEYVWRNPATSKDEVRYGGEPGGFIIELENGFKIYHMGDTGLFGDMKFIGEYYKPDLVMVPIGGNFTINAQLGVYAIREIIKPRYAIPMHYGTFPILAGKPEDFAKGLEGSSTRAIIMNPGEEVKF